MTTSEAHRARLTNLFTELPADFTLIDAKKDLKDITPTKIDLRGAIPLDPQRCVLARAFHRQFNQEALIYRTVAYVRRSKRTVVKYGIPKSTGNVTAAFDKSSNFPTGIPFTLSVPDIGHSVENGGTTRASRAAKPFEVFTPPGGKKKVGATAGRGRKQSGAKHRTKAQIEEAKANRRPLSPRQQELT